ncbi:MAG: hypothetical protein IIZ78_16900, partial [Clostridiales bacterium]|nr:hypothetical protein [Clostridiales bacterium]
DLPYMYQYFANVLPETSIMMTNITADAIRDMSLIILTTLFLRPTMNKMALMTLTAANNICR